MDIDIKAVPCIINKLEKLLAKKEGVTGICSEIQGVYAGTYHLDGIEFVRLNCTDWEHYSGSPWFPIKSPDKEIRKDDYYFFCTNVWVGEYGEARKDLCRHLIGKLKEKL